MEMGRILTYEELFVFFRFKMNMLYCNHELSQPNSKIWSIFVLVNIPEIICLRLGSILTVQRFLRKFCAFLAFSSVSRDRCRLCRSRLDVQNSLVDN